MSKPDFSGTWNFNPAKSLLQIAAPDATLFIIDHREPDFRITRTHIVGEKSDTFKLDLTTNGKSVLVERSDVKLNARAYWEDDILIFDVNLVRDGDEGSNVVRYELDGTRRTITARECFRSKNLNYDNIWVLDKQ